jgi:hypothetical protein
VRQILDFYHAAEYLTIVADAQFARDPRARKQCLDDACTLLKHDPAGAQVLIAQMQDFLTEHLQLGPRGKIKAALTYFHAPATVNELCPPFAAKLAFGFRSHRSRM